ncbi:MAG: hypothetical protein AAB706_02280 [Patescibacteria group bacterium]
MKKFPKTLFVAIENQGTQDEFLNATVKVEDVLFDGDVAIYELKKIGKRKTVVSLEEAKK